MEQARRLESILVLALLACNVLGERVCAANWEHQNMAWVLGPDSTTIRSPLDTPQPTGLSWSIVPGETGSYPLIQENRYGVNMPRYTQPITALGASGLSEFADYQALLGDVIDEWANACGITNLGYMAEDGSVPVGGIIDTDGDGVYITDRGPAAGVGHIRFMAFDSNWMSVSASATYIPEPGSNVDNASNHRKAGDIRFQAGHFIWGKEGQVPDTLYFRNIALHEVGHTLGFGHNNISGSVMNAGYEWNLGSGDIEGALAIYGAVSGSMPGDFDDDSDVDGDDFLLWQINFPILDGTAGNLTGDADGDGNVDGDDFLIWQSHFPFPTELGQIPEPASLGFFVLGGLLMLHRRAR